MRESVQKNAKAIEKGVKSEGMQESRWIIIWIQPENESGELRREKQKRARAQEEGPCP